MFRSVSFALVAWLVISSDALAQEQGDALAKIRALNWLKAPATATLAAVAQIKLSNGLAALDAADTSKFLQLNGNPAAEDNFAVSRLDFRWFSVFTFDPSGYVKDDEKIDPDALLTTLKEQNKRGIEERKSLGLEPLVLIDWYVPPHYDVQSRRLEWATKLKDTKDNIIVNYSIRLLGRGGVMNALLVSEPATLDQDVREFHAALLDVTFIDGQKYTEFRSGDKVAEYGLAALIVGGAAAVAVKTGAGFFKVIGMGLLASLAALGGFIKRLFGNNKKK